MCRECVKVMTVWDYDNMTAKEKFQYFGPHRTDDGLCAYHSKIKAGLTDPPSEVDYSIKAKQIWNYRPLVYKLAREWSEITGLDREDISQEGMLALAEIADKVDWESSPKSISSYINRCVVGYMKNYMAKMGTTVALPHFHEKDKTSMDIEVLALEEEHLHSGVATQEEVVIGDERSEEFNKRIGRLMIEGTLTEREKVILFWHVMPTVDGTKNPTIRELASDFKCSKSSIARDKERLLNLLKEGDNANF